VKRNVDYVVVLDDGIRKRHMHETERGQVTRFAVQLELRIGVVWMPVIRYDNAHGFTHKDIYSRDGSVVKEGLDLGIDSALTYGDWDINENWEQYVRQFTGGQ